MASKWMLVALTVAFLFLSTVIFAESASVGESITEETVEEKTDVPVSENEIEETQNTEECDSSLQDSLNSVTLKAQETEKDLGKALKDNENLMKEIQNLKEEIEQASQGAKSQAQSVSELQESVQRLKEANEVLESAKESAEADALKQKGLAEEADGKIAPLQESVLKLETTRDELQGQLEKLKESSKLNDEQTEAKDLEIAALKSSLGESKAKMKTLEDEKKLLEDTVSKQESDSSEKLIEITATNEKLRSGIKALSDDAADKQTKIDELVIELQESKSLLEKERASAVDLSSTNAEYEAKIESILKEKAEESANMQKRIDELQSRLNDLADSSEESAKLSARIDELENNLKVDMQECQAESNSLHEELKFHRQGVHIVAMYRALEHIETVKKAGLTFYADTVVPNSLLLFESARSSAGELNDYYAKVVEPQVQEAIKALDPHTEKLWQVYAESFEPVWNEKALPLYDQVKEQSIESLSNFKETAQMKYEDFKVFWAQFRERGIRTLKRNENFAANAEEIFDGCVNAIIVLSLFLLAGTLYRIVLSLFWFALLLPFRILLLPFKIFCCIFCCGCFRGRKPKSTARRLNEK